MWYLQSGAARQASQLPYWNAKCPEVVHSLGMCSRVLRTQLETPFMLATTDIDQKQFRELLPSPLHSNIWPTRNLKPTQSKNASTGPLETHQLNPSPFFPGVRHCGQYKLSYIITMLQSLRRSFARTSFRFGSQKEHTSRDSLEDWEYCRQISHSLKNKDLNSALSLLFQSYFNGKVLDLQIYNSVFTTINQQNLPLSYSEVTYSVFREHFPPHLLMLNWMNKLSQSSDQPFIEKLKLDFQALTQPFPKKSRRADKANPVIREVEEGTRSRKSRLTRNSEGDPSKDTIEPPEVQFIDGDSLTAEQLVKLRMQADLRNALGQINSGVGNFGKINLFDVEIQFSQNEAPSMDNQIYDDEGQDDEQMMSPEMGFMGLDISKIKIGRVEFLANPDEDKNDD